MPVETAAVAPTLLLLAGVKDSIQSQGYSDQSSFTTAINRPPGKASQFAYSETFYPFSSFGWSPLHALESERFHFIDAPKPELYDLTSDPGETRDIAAEQPATAAVLQEKLQSMLSTILSCGQLSCRNSSPDAQDKLAVARLLWISRCGFTRGAEEGLADPKDKLWEFNAIFKAEDAFHLQHDDAAKARSRRSRKGRQIYVIPFLLGESALRRQNWEKAPRMMQHCLVLNPNFDNAMTATGTGTGKTQSQLTKQKLGSRKPCRAIPQNYRAWYQSGFSTRATCRSGPICIRERPCRSSQIFPPGSANLECCYLRRKILPVAAPHLEKAIESWARMMREAA